MEFATEITWRVNDIYPHPPATIETVCEGMAVCRENVGFLRSEEEYVLTVDYTQEMKEKFLSYRIGEGDCVSVWKNYAPTATGDYIHRPDDSLLCCYALIESEEENRISFRLYPEIDVQDFLEALSDDLICFENDDYYTAATLFLKTYEQKYPQSGKAIMLNYYGKFESGAIVAKVTGTDEAYSDALWTETVGGYDIEYNNGNRISALYEGNFYTLTKAYENGYLKDGDIADIAEKNRRFYSYLYGEEN